MFKKYKETFDSVISLGYKCEVAYSVEAILGKVESNLFNWVNILHVDNLIYLLKHPNCEIAKNLYFEDFSFMYRDLDLDFRYHTKQPNEYFIGENKLTNIEEDKKEVHSRFSYLKNKFFNQIYSNSKNLFIMCFQANVEPKDVNLKLKELSSLIKNISGNSMSKIIVIFEKKYYKKLNLEKFDNIYIYTISHFSPDSYAHGIDFKFWKNLYKNFNFSFAPNVDYKTNIQNFIKNRNVVTLYEQKHFKFLGIKFSFKKKLYDIKKGL